MRSRDPDPDKIRVTLLGTGTPNLSDDQWGPSTLVQAGGTSLLFDCGRGTLLRIRQAGVNPARVSTVFLTHLHSDHVVGLPDLWLTGWELGREALSLHGPEGTASMASHLMEAFSADIEGRQKPPQSLIGDTAQIHAKDIAEGVVYSENGVKVTCFTVDHGSFKPAYGYRVDYIGCSVALSGDTVYSDNLVEHTRGVDVLIHNAWVAEKDSAALQLVASPEEAAAVFNLVEPRLAVISHYNTEEELAERIKAVYAGELVIGKDLMRIAIPETGQPKIVL